MSPHVLVEISTSAYDRRIGEIGCRLNIPNGGLTFVQRAFIAQNKESIFLFALIDRFPTVHIRPKLRQKLGVEGIMRSTLTTIIIIGMLLGIAVGYACHTLWPDPAVAKSISEYISLITDIFLRLIKMII